MNVALRLLLVGSVASSFAEPKAALRWEVASLAVGVVILSVGLTGLAFFFLRRKTGDRSLLFFSLFALMYALRLIFRQSMMRASIPAPEAFWNYTELVTDNFIVLPLTLFLIEIVDGRWKTVLRWVLGFQVVFTTTRFALQLRKIGEGPREIVYHLVVIAYCLLLFAYPLSFARRGWRMRREVKAVFAGLAIFGLFVIFSNALGLARISRGFDLEPIGFLVLVCCLGYVAASRTYSNEQHLTSLKKELEIARQIQSAILPRDVPHVQGLDIAARHLPMTAVAGDFYDFLVMDDKRMGILVADVTGHGVPAALIASMLKSALAAQSAYAADPARVLSGLNHALCGKFEEHFVTAGYLFVDTEKHMARYAGAGHPPLFYGSMDGRRAAYREIEANGLLLGLSEEAEYAAVELAFRPGDRCVLYTDGVLETKNAAQEEFGAARFRNFLEVRASLAAGPLIAASLAEVDRWSGRGDAGHEDDITLIAVGFEAAG
jgi:phosphoserine phosphatase RsbU/P